MIMYIINWRIFMILKFYKFLVVSSLLAGNVNTLYSMDYNDNNINNNIDIEDVNNSPRNILKELQDDEKTLKEYNMRRRGYEQELYKIKKEMLEYSEPYKIHLKNIDINSVEDMYGIKNIFESNNTVLNLLHHMLGLSIKMNGVINNINDVNRVIESKNSNIRRIIEDFHNNLLGNNFDKLNVLFSNCSEQELKIVYQILARKEVNEYFLDIYYYPLIINKSIPIEECYRKKYKAISGLEDNDVQMFNKELDELFSQFKKQINSLYDNAYNNMVNILKELNTIKQNNAHNIIKNKIIDVIIGYVNHNKDEISKHKAKRINGALSSFKYR